jgi:hypothetical protein
MVNGWRSICKLPKQVRGSENTRGGPSRIFDPQFKVQLRQQSFKQRVPTGSHAHTHRLTLPQPAIALVPFLGMRQASFLKISRVPIYPMQSKAPERADFGRFRALGVSDIVCKRNSWVGDSSRLPNGLTGNKRATDVHHSTATWTTFSDVWRAPVRLCDIVR